MRRLQADRKEEVKALAKKHRDRDELVRVKREVATAVVDRGVSERERLGQAYENKRDELQRQHDAVKSALAESKAKVLQILILIYLRWNIGSSFIFYFASLQKKIL